MRFLITMLMLGLVLLLHAAPVLASCRTHSYQMDGRFYSCMTCCYLGSCTTTCN